MYPFHASIQTFLCNHPISEMKLMTDCFLCVLQTETKPVQMMNLEATFCLGYVKDLNVAILELPCLNKHISMLILLPKEIEDETTGLEKVREKNRIAMILPLETAHMMSYICGRFLLFRSNA